MNIAIVGAGIVGVTTAFELGADGHAVTVFERRGAAAEETSFANAGVIAPGYVTPWAAPGMPAKVLRQWFAPHSAVHLRWPLSLRELAWLAAFRRACRPETWRANRARLQRLAFYSRTRLHELSVGLDLHYDCSPGYLVLLRGERERAAVRAGLPLLDEAGVRYEELGPEAARSIEPALDPQRALAGALHLPDDGVANCRQVAQLLRREAESLGVVFEFGRTVLPLDAAAPNALRIAQIDGEVQTRRFDAVVVCGGVESAALLHPVGLKVPLIPVWGYSITAALGDPLNAPRSGLMDERYKVAISRLGERVRVAGSAGIGGRAHDKDAATLRTLYKVLQDWFPAAARLAGKCVTVQEWKGARPMLPDGPPVLGASGVPGIWLNIGHGSSGWALACGSARAVADLVGGRAPAVDLEGLDIARLRG
ncbi:D-amino acid dehydrogenase [Ramlibacter sp. AN1015]|uniref:D-amino acid dehydrogenase n=1 Tax=Ramlibacter sp. AN1015 TaxID=3133428 RepID=UPI0030C3CA08